MRNLLRGRDAHHEEKVGPVELFFDLVFVFAVTQISHRLIEHPDAMGFMQAAMLMTAIWWVWVDTAWVTNWLDVRHMPVRLLLFILMIPTMLMAIAMPQAFGERAWLFAVAYVASQLGRPLFMILALKVHSPVNHVNFIRIFLWSLIEAPFWIAGAVADGEIRIALWLIGLALACTGPIMGFWMPRLGSSASTSWDVEGHHFSERCALFIIIALGESILLTGTGYAGAEWSWPANFAFAGAFVGTVAMWWLYFDIGAERAALQLARHADPGSMARLAYTYFHIPIIAGIIVTAASDEMVIAHPAGHASIGVAAALLGGPALYVLGNMLFKGASSNHRPLSHWAGLGLLGVVALVHFVWTELEPLALSLLATGVLVLVAAWEMISLSDTRRALSEAGT